MLLITSEMDLSTATLADGYDNNYITIYFICLLIFLLTLLFGMREMKENNIKMIALPQYFGF
jgi:hypothetical protein